MVTRSRDEEADEFYKEWCDLMVAREIEVKEQPKLKKIAGGKK